MKNDGGNIFPIVYVNEGEPISFGMSLRDHFAAKAMAAFIGNTAGNFGVDYPQDNLNLAMASYAMADAMLIVRSK